MNPARHVNDLRQPDPLVSVVLPLYNEAAVLAELHQRVDAALQQSGCQYEILFINDGSTDDGGEQLDRLAAQQRTVRVLHLSRNFGQQAAVQAGIEHAAGDAVIVMDSDLQDDPAALIHFIDHWRNGYDVVYAVRRGRKENRLKRCLFYAFYRVLNAVSRTPMPMDAGNFGLIDRAVARELVRLPERDRYFPGLRSWTGFRQIGIPVERGRRHDDRPRISLLGLFRLAKTALFSFSTVPLSLFYVIAALSLLTCTAVTGFSLYHKCVTGLALPGWTSVTIVASFFGSLNALGIGILGEYVIRIHDQVRGRPGYIVGRAVNFSSREERPSRNPEAELLDWLSENWASPRDPSPTTNRNGTVRH